MPPTVRPSGIGIDRVADRQGRAHVAVQLPLHLDGVAGEVGAREVVALLEEHHRVSRLGELFGDDRAARAGADDDDVALDGVVARRAPSPP